MLKLLQISFSFDEASVTSLYEITLRSSDGIFWSLNQTTTSFNATNLIPGQIYDITIIAFDNGLLGPPTKRSFATAKCYYCDC